MSLMLFVFQEIRVRQGRSYLLINQKILPFFSHLARMAEKTSRKILSRLAACVLTMAKSSCIGNKFPSLIRRGIIHVYSTKPLNLMCIQVAGANPFSQARPTWDSSTHLFFTHWHQFHIDCILNNFPKHLTNFQEV